MTDRIIDSFLDIIIQKNASDMFLTYDEYPSLRVNMQIKRLENMQILNDNILDTIFIELVNTERSKLKFQEELNIDLSIAYNHRRFRINISQSQWHVMVVIRLLMDKIPKLADITNERIIHDIVKKPSGIILVAGPTGSGKSTLLAAMIQEINKSKEKHIISVEDPIEYIFEPEKCIIEQKELYRDVVSFSSALKFALRQNPDVILFGEMRDQDSIKNAITLAETWHLVLTTIHSKSSGQTISKIIDSFPSWQQNQVRVQLSETLLAVISQRMFHTKNHEGIALAQEIMVNNSAVSNSIRKNDIKGLNSIIMTGSKYGMKILESDLIKLVEQDIIELQDALFYANNPAYILEYFNQE